MSNSELINTVDLQLMQIREDLAAFCQQYIWFRERLDSLNGSVNKLTLSQSNLSSYTSDCSNIGSLDENEEFFEQTTVRQSEGQRARQLVKGSKDHFKKYRS